MSGQPVERAVSDVTALLLYPVLILALVALVVSVAELGRVGVEIGQRRGRSLRELDATLARVRDALARGDPDSAARVLRAASGSARMGDAAVAILATVRPDLVVGGEVAVRAPAGDGEARRAKTLADFDYASLRSLERTRVLVRAGPALGLMGTLIPLSPALDALSRGDVARLAQDLRVAFSVTVVGLLTGALAFSVSLIRDRLYGQDLSDLEYVGATLGPLPRAAPDPGVR